MTGVEMNQTHADHFPLEEAWACMCTHTSTLLHTHPTHMESFIHRYSHSHILTDSPYEFPYCCCNKLPRTWWFIIRQFWGTEVPRRLTRPRSICAGVCICYKSVPTQSSFCCRKINHLFQVAVSFASGILLLTSLSKIKATLTYPLPYAIFLSCWTAYYIYWVLFLLLSHRPDMNWSMEMFSSLCKTTEQVALDSEGWGKAYPKVKMSPHTGLWQTLLSYSICIEIN